MKNIRTRIMLGLYPFVAIYNLAIGLVLTITALIPILNMHVALSIFDNE